MASGHSPFIPSKKLLPFINFQSPLLCLRRMVRFQHAVRHSGLLLRLPLFRRSSSSHPFPLRPTPTQLRSMRSRRRRCRRTGINCRFPARKIPHLSLRQELGFERCRGHGVRIVMSSGVVAAAAAVLSM